VELRKVCNHPYLVNGAEDQIALEWKALFHADQVSPAESRIRSAGKMILLDKLLTKLKADGHRVLVFSQMQKMLDILGEYLAAREYPFRESMEGFAERIAKRQSIISTRPIHLILSFIQESKSDYHSTPLSFKSASSQSDNPQMQ
jgi:chromodomain-helicase-DNA-binding protein 7